MPQESNRYVDFQEVLEYKIVVRLFKYLERVFESYK